MIKNIVHLFVFFALLLGLTSCSQTEMFSKAHYKSYPKIPVNTMAEKKDLQIQSVQEKQVSIGIHNTEIGNSSVPNENVPNSTPNLLGNKPLQKFSIVTPNKIKFFHSNLASVEQELGPLDQLVKFRDLKNFKKLKKAFEENTTDLGTLEVVLLILICLLLLSLLGNPVGFILDLVLLVLLILLVIFLIRFLL
jgi:hypothetical protein